jgi:cation transport ATPase
MTSDPRQEWENELRNRQTHNYVFPGTMINSTAAIRQLVNRPFRGRLQKFGFLLWLCPGYVTAVFIISVVYEGLHDTALSWREAALNLAIGIGTLVAVAACAAVVIGIAYSIQRVRDYHENLRIHRIRSRWHMPVGRRRRRGSN